MTQNYKLHLGDNLATLKTYPDNHFDSIVTDPPYGIEFLGKDWDRHVGTIDLYKECLRVLKPGGYMLAFSAARTYHQLASNIESAGFEIRDQLMWLYSSGFPKAQDIGKAIQKRIGVEETTEYKTNSPRVGGDGEFGADGSKPNVSCTSPVAKQWAGYKTALKPAHEPIVMARKPFKGSTIDNVLKNGLGAMNIDATRVPWADGNEPAPGSGTPEWRTGGPVFVGDGDTKEKKKKSDREKYLEWEAKWGGQNQAGGAPTFQGTEKKKKSDREIAKGGRAVKGVFVGGGHSIPNTENQALYETNDGGRYPSNVIGEVEPGYQKYFYCPKVSRRERHVGFAADTISQEQMIEAMGGKKHPHTNNRYWTEETGWVYIHGLKEHYKQWCEKNSNTVDNRGNNHPTVKPVALMDYLIRLVTPPSTPELQRKVLDPFMGSGSTGMAATALGHYFVGCDLDPNYIKISETRIEAWNNTGLPKGLFGEDHEE
jgi:site-specific DNA-methyltransferase (adenine-specific)